MSGSGVSASLKASKFGGHDSASTIGSSLRTDHGELLEPIVYDQLQFSLQRNSPALTLSAGSPSGSSLSIALGNNNIFERDNNIDNFQLNAYGKDYIDSGTESGDDSNNKKQGELTDFMESVRSTMEDSIDNVAPEKLDQSPSDRESGEFSTDFMLEVNSVLDKLKGKLGKSKSQSFIGVDDVEDNNLLVSLIGRLQSSLGDVLSDQNPENVTSNVEQDEMKEIKTTTVDESNHGEELESDIDINIDHDLRRSESGLYHSSSFCSSAAGSPGVVMGGLQFSVDLGESTGTVLNVDQSRGKRNNTTDSGVLFDESSETLQRKSSRKDARSLLGKAIGRCKSREDVVRQQSVDPNDDYIHKEDSDCEQIVYETTDDSKYFEHELPKKKDQKDLP